MDTLILVWFFILGTVIGSFLNVVIYRFNTGKSLSGRSHCLSCGARLSWHELLPIVSYVAQKGRCRRCSARITSRYLCVEALTGFLFLLCAHLFLSDAVTLILNLGVVSVLVVILVYDLRHTIIPDTLVLHLLALALAYSLWNPATQTVGLPSVWIMYGIMLGGVIPAGFLGGLWFVSGGRWIGLGDAKLAFPLGLILGASGSVSMLVLAFWIGAALSVGVLALQKVLHNSLLGSIHRGQPSFLFLRSRLTIKSEVPFAPFLICAFFLVHLAHVDPLAIITAITASFVE